MPLVKIAFQNWIERLLIQTAFMDQRKWNWIGWFLLVVELLI